jgi:hypothetical protein
MSTAVFSPRSQCGTKLGFDSKARAKRVARQSETTHGGGRVQPYRCPWCSTETSPTWHIGHRPGRRLQVGGA